MVELVSRELARMSNAPSAKPDGVDAVTARAARAHAVVGAFLGTASWWLDAGDGLSAEAVDALFQGVVAPERS